MKECRKMKPKFKKNALEGLNSFLILAIEKVEVNMLNIDDINKGSQVLNKKYFLFIF